MMGLAAIHWGEVWAAAAVVTAVLGLGLGIPTWRLAQRALDAEDRQKRIEETTRVVKQVVAGPGEPPPRSQDHPSLLDLMESMEANNQEVAWLVSVVAWHISDGHGAPIPDALLRGSRPR